eukprot:12592319-Alexandrium_andersonii.AAC.1
MFRGPPFVCSPAPCHLSGLPGSGVTLILLFGPAHRVVNDVPLFDRKRGQHWVIHLQRLGVSRSRRFLATLRKRPYLEG